MLTTASAALPTPEPGSPTIAERSSGTDSYVLNTRSKEVDRIYADMRVCVYIYRDIYIYISIYVYISILITQWIRDPRSRSCLCRQRRRLYTASASPFACLAQSCNPGSKVLCSY